MCGIAGFIARHHEPCIGRMVQSLAHRGPDGEGRPRSASVEKRPVGSATGAWQSWTFLKALDSRWSRRRPLLHRVQRRGLQLPRDPLPTRRARRILHQPFRHRGGPESVSRLGGTVPGSLHGMFAFAIWDAERGRLFLARDRWASSRCTTTSQRPALLRLGTARPARVRMHPAPAESCGHSRLSALRLAQDPDTRSRG